MSRVYDTFEILRQNKAVLRESVMLNSGWQRGITSMTGLQ